MPEKALNHTSRSSSLNHGLSVSSATLHSYCTHTKGKALSLINFVKVIVFVNFPLHSK